MPGVLDPTIPVDIGERSQRQRIIDAMIESCAEKTYSATTIADIVKRASISRTTFYKRFPNKRACFDGALEHCLDALQEVATDAYDPSDQPAETLRKATAATLEMMAAKPALAQLIVGDAVTVEPAIVRRYRELVVPAVEGLWATDGSSAGSHTDPKLAFGRAQVLIFNEIAAGRTAQLPELLPEIVYVALLPFAGHEEAARQASIATNGSPTGPGRR